MDMGLILSCLELRADSSKLCRREDAGPVVRWCWAGGRYGIVGWLDEKSFSASFCECDMVDTLHLRKMLETLIIVARGRNPGELG